MSKLMYGEEEMNPIIKVVEKTGDDDERFVTQAQYDALPVEKESNNIKYFVN